MADRDNETDEDENGIKRQDTMSPQTIKSAIVTAIVVYGSVALAWFLISQW